MHALGLGADGLESRDQNPGNNDGHRFASGFHFSTEEGIVIRITSNHRHSFFNFMLSSRVLASCFHVALLTVELES